MPAPLASGSLTPRFAPYRQPGSEPASAFNPRLTPREREVLAWVAAGKTNRDIAAIVGARPRTIDKHLEHIYEKLGVETRVAAVMRANVL
jgi:DNA-binding CsgD family transcriptional regulator